MRQPQRSVSVYDISVVPPAMFYTERITIRRQERNDCAVPYKKTGRLESTNRPGNGRDCNSLEVQAHSEL